MTMTNQEKITLLESFDAHLKRLFDGNYKDSEQEQLRQSVNEIASQAHEIVKEYGCLKSMSLTPPPMIGGPILQNVDPFNMIFTSYYGMSLIPNVRDMTRQAVGVIRTGKILKGSKSKQSLVGSSGNIEAPDKVTFHWLFKHVPVSLWLIGLGLLASAFALGLKAREWGFVKDILGSP